MSIIEQVANYILELQDGTVDAKKAFKTAQEKTAQVLERGDTPEALTLFLAYFEAELGAANFSKENIKEISTRARILLQAQLEEQKTPVDIEQAVNPTFAKPATKKQGPIITFDDLTPQEMISQNPQATIDDLTKVLNLMPSDDVAYFYRAKAQAELKNYYNAIRDITEAIKYNKSNPEYFYDSSWYKRFVGDYQGAARDLKEASKLNQGRAEYVYNLAVLQRGHLNQLSEAVENFKKAVALNPGSELYSLSLEEAQDALANEGETEVNIPSMAINNFIESINAKIPANLTEAQEVALQELVKQVQKLHEEKNIAKTLDKLSIYKEALSVILMSKPILNVNGTRIGDDIVDSFLKANSKDLVNVSVGTDMRANDDLAARLMPDFKERLKFYVSNMANSHEEFTVVLNMHGSINGVVVMEEETNLPAVLKLIQENSGSSKINIIATSCHGQAGDPAFIQQIINYGFNYLGTTGKNDSFHGYDIKNIFNYDLPTAFINAIMLGYYGAILIYEGKVYRALDFAKEYYKDNPTKLKEIELLQEYYFGEKPAEAMLQLGNLSNYNLSFFRSIEELARVSNIQENQLSKEEIEKIVLNNPTAKHMFNRMIYMGYPFVILNDDYVLTLTQPSAATKKEIIQTAKTALAQDNVEIINEDLVTKPGNMVRKQEGQEIYGVPSTVDLFLDLTSDQQQPIINARAPEYTEAWASFATLHPNDILLALNKVPRKKLLVKDKYGKLPVEYALKNAHKIGQSPQNNAFTYVYLYSAQAGLNPNVIVDKKTGLTLAMLTLMLEDNHFPFAMLQSNIDWHIVDVKGDSILKYIIEGVTPMETAKFLFSNMSETEIVELVNMVNAEGKGVIYYIDNAKNLSSDDKIKVIRFFKERGLKFNPADENLVSSLKTRELRDYSTEMVKKAQEQAQREALIAKAEHEFANPTSSQAVASVREGESVSMSPLSYVDDVLAIQFIYQAKDINEVNGEGMTALMYAAQNPNPKVTELVLKKGGRANIQTQAGRALLIAQAANNIAVLKILEKKDKVFKREQKNRNNYTEQLVSLDPEKTAFLGQKNLLPKKKDLNGLYVSLETFGDPIVPLQNAQNLRAVTTDNEVKVKEEKKLGEVYMKIAKRPFEGTPQTVMAILQGNGRLFILNHGIALKGAMTGKLEADIYPDVRRYYGLVRIIHNHIPGVKAISKKDVMLLPEIVRSTPFFEDAKFAVFHVSQTDGTVLKVVFAKVSDEELIITSMQYITSDEAAKDAFSKEELNSMDKENNSSTEIQGVVNENGDLPAANIAPVTTVTEQTPAVQETPKQEAAPVVQERYVSPLAAFLPNSDYYIDDTLVKKDVANFAESGKQIRGLKPYPSLAAMTNKNKAYFNPEDFYGKEHFDGEYSVENPQDYTVLVVQDDLNVFDRTVTSLKMKGFNVLEAKDGEKAVSILDATKKGGNKIHFVFIDTFVSYVNGYKIAEKIEKEGFDTITILSSGRGEKERHYKQGFDFQLSASGNDMLNSGDYIGYLIQKYGFKGTPKGTPSADTAKPTDNSVGSTETFYLNQNQNLAAPIELSELNTQANLTTEIKEESNPLLFLNGKTNPQNPINNVLPLISFLPDNPYNLTGQIDLDDYVAVTKTYVRENDIKTAPSADPKINKDRTYYNEEDFWGNEGKPFEGEYTVENPQEYNILVVQDEEKYSRPLSFSLRQKGFNVKVAQNGNDAMAIIESSIKSRTPIHFVFLDSFIPGTNGYRIAQRINNLDLDTIVISSSQGSANALDRYKRGFDFSYSVSTNNLYNAGDFTSYLIQKYGFKGGGNPVKIEGIEFNKETKTEVKQRINNPQDYTIAVVNDNQNYKNVLNTLREQGFTAVEGETEFSGTISVLSRNNRTPQFIVVDKNNQEINTEKIEQVLQNEKNKDITIVKVDYRNADFSKINDFISGLIQTNVIDGVPFVKNTDWTIYDKEDVDYKLNTKNLKTYVINNPQDYTVLVAQDNSKETEAIAKILKDKGYNVITAANSSDVLKILEEYNKNGQTIHFALLDNFYSDFIKGQSIPGNGQIIRYINEQGLNTITVNISHVPTFDGDFHFDIRNKNKIDDFLSYLIEKYGFKGNPQKPEDLDLEESSQTYYLYKEMENLMGLSQEEDVNLTTEIKEESNTNLYTQNMPADALSPTSVTTMLAFFPFIFGRKIKSSLSLKNNHKKTPTNIPLYFTEDITKDEEIPLNFHIKVSPDIKTAKNYDKVIFDAKGVAYFKDNNSGKLTYIPHFYMEIPDSKNDLRILMGAAKKAKLATSFDLKFIMAGYETSEFQRITLYGAHYQVLNVVALLPDGYLKEGERLMYSNGAFYIFNSKTLKRKRELTDFILRIPKKQIPNLVEVLANVTTKPTIYFNPTRDKASVVYREAMFTNISIGKTFGGIVKNELGVSTAVSNGMMFGIQYVVPVFALFMGPLVKKLGEKNTLILALCFSVAAGTFATTAGFYGMAPGATSAAWQKVVFLLSFGCMSLSTLFRQLVSSILIRDNSGILKDTDERASKPEEEEGQGTVEKNSFKKIENESFGEYFKRINRQIFGRPKHIYSMTDDLILSKAAVFKSIGTLIFLGFPFIVNGIARLVTWGKVTSLVDFSASFPLLALYSLYTTIKIWNTNLRNRTPIPTKAERVKAKKERKKERKKRREQFRENVRDYGFFPIVNKNIKDRMDTLRGKIKVKRDAFNLKKQINKIQKTFTKDNLNVKKELLKNKYKENSKIYRFFGMLSFANAHEVVISSALANQLSNLFTNSATSNFLIALGLYAPLLLGRWMFGIVRGKTTRASSTIAFTTLSLLGTLIMLFTTKSIPLLITGAAIASLGMGNCFTLLYSYIRDLYPANKELQISTSSTLAAVPGAILAMLSPILVQNGHLQGAILYGLVLLTGLIILSWPAMEGLAPLTKWIKDLFTPKEEKTTMPKAKKPSFFDNFGKWWHFPPENQNGPDMNNPEPQN